MSVSELLEALQARRISSAEVVRASLDAIDRQDGTVHAFLEVFADRALNDARRSDDRRARGEAMGPLAGVPVALKDNICLEWGRTTCGSMMLAEYRSPYTATAAQRLLDAGAVVIGKTNLDEFAMGSSCESSAFGPTRNPWAPSRVPGGSSGGSAAAVAAGMAPAALGSDTGGSIRQPAGWCNLVGFKPTYGRVSRYGLVAYASSLDQIGPLTRTVRDAALLAEVIGGHDANDSTSVPSTLAAPMTLLRHLDELAEGARGGESAGSGRGGTGGPIIGVVRAWRNAPGNHPDVNAAVERAVRTLEERGATVIDVDLAHLEHAIAAYYIIAPAEASSNLARYDGIRYGQRGVARPGEDLIGMTSRIRAEGFGPEVRRRIMLGTHVLSSGYADRYYQTALRARRLIKRAYDALFDPASHGLVGPACDALIMPSSPGPAFRLGERTADPLALYLEDVYTVGINLAGLPAVTVPAGFASVEGGGRMPLGLQFVGAAFDEARLLRIARMFESATNHHAERPPVLP